MAFSSFGKHFLDVSSAVLVSAGFYSKQSKKKSSIKFRSELKDLEPPAKYLVYSELRQLKPI